MMLLQIDEVDTASLCLVRTSLHMPCGKYVFPHDDRHFLFACFFSFLKKNGGDGVIVITRTYQIPTYVDFGCLQIVTRVTLHCYLCFACYNDKERARNSR